MRQQISIIRSLAIVLTLTVLAIATSAQAAPEKSLYERLGGVFAISAVVDHTHDPYILTKIKAIRDLIAAYPSRTPNNDQDQDENNCERPG